MGLSRNDQVRIHQLFSALKSMSPKYEGSVRRDRVCQPILRECRHGECTLPDSPVLTPHCIRG